MLIYNREPDKKSNIKPRAPKLIRHTLTAANKSFLKSIGLKLKQNVKY